MLPAEHFSGGSLSYAYGLYLDMNQLQTVFERLHTRVPTAQLHDFTAGPLGPVTKPGYSRFTPYPENIWDYADSIVDPLLLLGEVAVSWALLIVIIIVASREAHTLLKCHRELSRDAVSG